MCDCPELPVIAFYCLEHDKWYDRFPEHFEYTGGCSCPMCRGEEISRRIDKKELAHAVEVKKASLEQLEREKWIKKHGKQT